MSIAPVVIRSKSTPFLSIACAVVVVYMVIKAALFGGELGAFSLLLGAVVAAIGLVWMWLARNSSVLIDRDQFVVNRGRRSNSYQRSNIAGVDLSGLERHITFEDGTGVKLPLEGPELVEAGILLSPPRL